MNLPIIKFLLLIVILAAVHSYSDETYSKNKRGNNLYKNQQYKEALKVYDDAVLLSPSDSRLKMNKGSTHYQLGEFDKAEEAYNAALSSDNKEQLADAHYNMGNILFREGAQMYQQGPQQALEKFKSAYDHYIKSLEMRPSDTDTKWNLQLAHQVMKQLEQQQKQQQDQNKDQKNKDDKNKQDKNDQNKNDQNQNKQDQKDQKDQQQQQQDKKEDQNNQEQNKDQQQKDEQKQDQQSEQDKKDQSDQKEQQQQQMQQSEMKDQQDLKKEEAKRIIEMYADDADTLNKPMTKQKVGARQPLQDW
jgi:tetratricopeptide (TPR) repeat protein